jgi:Spy/CpxP family protein refolding chaperone
MRSLWSLVGVLALVLLAGNWLAAADEKKADSPAVKAKGTLPANWKKLGLTDDQVQKVYRIESDYREKIGVLEAQIKKLKEEQRAEMESVLTDAQKARLKEIRSGESAPKTDRPASGEK